MSAAGKVCTGFSSVFVAKYAAATSQGVTTITYSDGQELGRGVGFDLQITTTNGLIFYANNGAAESADGEFQSGNANITIDGLLAAAERMIMGLAAEDNDGFLNYGDAKQTPYVGVGVVGRFMSDGVTSYTPFILPKTKFQIPNRNMQTQEQTINFQTQQLTTEIFRADDADHRWMKVGGDETTEAAAITKIKTFLSIT